VKGAYTVAIGTILRACILLGRIAIRDWLTVLVSLASLAVLFCWKVSNPLLISATAVVGLIAFLLLQPVGSPLGEQLGGTNENSAYRGRDNPGSNGRVRRNR
jgi:chromate transport protein ChrA